MRPEILTACDHLLAAMMNGVWQGMVITALVALGLRALRRTNAATRHAVWFVTLMLLAAIIPAHALRDFPSRLEQGLAGSVGEALELGPESIVRTEDADHTASQSAAADFFARMSSSAEAPAGGLVGLTEPGGQVQPASMASDVKWVRRAVNRFLNPLSSNLTITARIPRAASLILLLLWLVVAGTRFALLFRGVRKIRWLKRASVPASVALAERFRALCRKLNVARNVELRISSKQRSPLLLGFIRPVILLPSDEAESSRLTESEHILSHELAHTQRRDDWANLVQHLVQAVLFFHPAVWWISKRMVFEREVACDDWVLQQGTRPRAYALLLADLAGRISRRPLLLAPGVSTTKSELQQRINMVLNTTRNASTRLATSRLGVITAAAALAAALALYFAPRLVLAQEQPVGNAPDAQELAELPDEAPTPNLPEPPALTPPATPSLPRPAIIALQNLAPAPPRPSINEPPDAGVAPHPDQPAALPRQPRRPEARSRDASLEERLARLEEMVHSLLAQKGARFTPGEAPAEWRESENMARMREQEMFERQNVRAAEDEARVRQEREREFRSEPGQRRQDKLRADLARRMKSLQEQRENLERQMQELRREIEKIEREQEGVKQRNEQDSQPKKRKTEPGE